MSSLEHEQVMNITQEVWPGFQIDTSLHRSFDEIDVSLPHVGQYLLDREMPALIVAQHTLTLASESPYNTPFGQAGGHYLPEDSTVSLYPETLIGWAEDQYVDEATRTNDWSQPPTLNERVKSLLDQFLTHELRHAIDYVEPEVHEAVEAYHRRINRLASYHKIRAAAAGIGVAAAVLSAEIALIANNPDLSALGLSVLMISAQTAGFARLHRRSTILMRSFYEAQYLCNPFEQRAIAAQSMDCGNFFTVALSHEAHELAQESIDQKRRLLS